MYELQMKKPRPPGFYLGAMCMAYAPSRFALDFLRVPEGELNGADLRYAGLTPAQWGCVALLGVGVYFAYIAGRSAEAPLGRSSAAAALRSPSAHSWTPSTPRLSSSSINVTVKPHSIIRAT